VILVDTSIWIAHFRATLPNLQRLLLDDRVLTHPFILGELACGNLNRLQEAMRWMRLLPAAVVAHDDEVLELIGRRQLSGHGIGWVDAHLLASALLFPCELFTRDQRLHAVASKLKLASKEL